MYAICQPQCTQCTKCGKCPGTFILKLAGKLFSREIMTKFTLEKHFWPTKKIELAKYSRVVETFLAIVILTYPDYKKNIKTLKIFQNITWWAKEKYLPSIFRNKYR